MSRLEKFLFLPIVVGIIVLGACSSNVRDEVPSPITSFVEQYYPGSGLSSYNQTDNGYQVKIANGATLSFDSDYSLDFRLTATVSACLKSLSTISSRRLCSTIFRV